MMMMMMCPLPQVVRWTLLAFAAAMVLVVQQQQESRNGVSNTAAVVLAFVPTAPAVMHPLRSISATTTTTTNTRGTALAMGMFGTKEVDADNLLTIVIPQKNVDDTTVAVLIEFVQSWGVEFFEDDAVTTTTPVKVLAVPNGVQLLFQKVASGYASRGLPRNDEKQKKQKKKKEPLQGGVEINVLDDAAAAAAAGVTVRAKRCHLDEDTMVKEMSETAIVTELKKAIAVWIQETAK